MLIEKLFESSIIIPEYQREYVWTEKNVSKLLNDVLEYFNNKNTENIKKEDYFLGSILLYDNGNEFEIIDGQQRIITLSLIYMEINNNENLKLNIYQSIFEKSKYNIKKNKEFIKNNINDIIKNNINNIKFTAIITKKQDDAFIFFDTHNTSGVRLKTVDLLKAYHLRALKCSDEETKNIVEKWNRDNSKDGMVEILENMLFTIRKSKAKSNKYLIKKDDNEDYVLNEFKSKNSSENNEIIFYPSSKNKLINKITIENNSIFYSTNNSYLNLDKYSLPFLIRQPLSDGLCFFLYSGKYKQLYKYLFEENTEIKYIHTIVYDKYNSSQIYLSTIFEYLLVFYYDKFEDAKILLEFALRIIYIISSYRLANDIYSIKASIYKKIIFDDVEINLFDVMDIYYDNNDIIKYFDDIIDTIEENRKIDFNNEYSGVKKRYFDNLKNCINNIYKNSKDNRIHTILEKYYSGLIKK